MMMEQGGQQPRQQGFDEEEFLKSVQRENTKPEMAREILRLKMKEQAMAQALQKMQRKAQTFVSDIRDVADAAQAKTDVIEGQEFPTNGHKDVDDGED